MRHIDWQMIFFIGTSLAQEYWIYWKLPRIYFWDIQREYTSKIETDDKKDAA